MGDECPNNWVISKNIDVPDVSPCNQAVNATVKKNEDFISTQCHASSYEDVTSEGANYNIVVLQQIIQNDVATLENDVSLIRLLLCAYSL